MTPPHFHSHSGDHDHSGHSGHGHPIARDGEVPRVLTQALLITILFMIVEAVGWYFSGSLALLSDAAHMFTDVGAILLSYFAYQVSQKPSTPKMTFGYHRAEILGALASGLIIWALAGALAYESIRRLGGPPPVNGPIVFTVAAIGLAANLLSMRMLHSAQKSNLNVKAAYLHMLTDCLGSLAAVVAGAILCWKDWRPIDPIVTILSAVLMLYSSWGLVKESVGILMESTPSHLDPKGISEFLESLTGVREIHDLHIWTVSSGRLALSVHMISDQPEMVLSQANEGLKERFGIVHTTIQIEHPEKFSSERCYDCAPG